MEELLHELAEAELGKHVRVTGAAVNTHIHTNHQYEQAEQKQTLWWSTWKNKLLWQESRYLVYALSTHINMTRKGTHTSSWWSLPQEKGVWRTHLIIWEEWKITYYTSCANHIKFLGQKTELNLSCEREGFYKANSVTIMGRKNTLICYGFCLYTNKQHMTLEVFGRTERIATLHLLPVTHCQWSCVHCTQAIAEEDHALHELSPRQSHLLTDINERSLWQAGVWKACCVCCRKFFFAEKRKNRMKTQM